MALDTNIKNLATRTGTEFKALRTIINGNAADLAALTTLDKTNLVAAINELQTEINNAVSSSGAVIDDTTPSTTKTYSSSKTQDLLTALKNEILGGAGAAYDTLQELKALMDTMDSEDQTAIDALTTAVGNRVRFDAAQTLTTLQQDQAKANIGLSGATDTVAGIVELATVAEATTGTDTARAVTPAGVKAVGDTKAPLSHTHAGTDVPIASETARGTVEFATAAETTTGTSTVLAVHPAGVKAVGDTKAPLSHTHAAGDLPAASTTASGISRLATTAESTTGTATNLAVTPAGLKTVADTKAAASHSHGAADLPAASETASGIIELATTTEATAGTDAVRAVTPVGLKAVADTKAAATHSHSGSDVTAATDLARGTVELATTAESTTGTDTTRAVTPAGLKAVADTKAAATHSHTATDLPAATETASGIVELATTTEATTGTDTTRAITAAGLKAVADGKAAATHTHAGSDVTQATDLARGTVELATNAEAITGTDAVRAITPAALMAVAGDSTTDYVALFNAALL